MSAGAALWTPDPARVRASAMDAFRRHVAEVHGVELADSVALHAWSVARPDAFWTAVWELGAVVGEPGPMAFSPGDGSITGGRFFPSATLNVVDTYLAGPPGPGAGARPALLWEGEGGERRRLDWDELRAQVAAAAGALRADGVRPGDRVAAWMPNVPETVVLWLATLGLGAVFSSCSPDFGTDAVVARFGQIEPTVLVGADGYRYGGRAYDCRDRLAAIAAGLPTVRRTVVVGHLAPDATGPTGAVPWDEWVAPFGASSLDLVRHPFDHPGAVLYSSGTTGRPKCIVHRAAALLLQHTVEHRLHCDVRADDRVLYFTTCGWMMWNWLVGTLAAGATVVLYDGDPGHPRPEALVEVADRHGATLLGASARYLDGLRRAGARPRRTTALPSLRTICSTGSPLAPEAFEYVYEHVHPDVHLASISGGTDLCGCFVAGDPTRPVHAGEIQGPVLGMAVDVFGSDGAPSRAGEPGELVCTRPFPSMPLGFWGDGDGSRYHEAYFERFEGVWAHGDLAHWTGHGGMVILGRSDTTLNVGGVRIGTAEIYRVLDQLPEVADSIAVAQEWDGDRRIVAFVVPASGVLDDDLVARIRAEVRERCSPRHVPSRVVAVSAVPRTRSGKLAESVVRDVVDGRPPRDVGGLADPSVLAQYARRPELEV